MNNIIFNHILQEIKKGHKLFALLIDPDSYTDEQIITVAILANKVKVDFFLVGGSLITQGNTIHTIQLLKQHTSIPVILFPGNATQITHHADALLLLSLISGRNADLLIGQQVQAASYIKANNIATIATGYILIDGGKPTSVSYMSNTQPIPADKPQIAAATAIAGELMGLSCIYLEAGSGAAKPVSENIIKAVRKNITIPLIVGGGIQTAEKAAANCDAGADIIVVGNAIEKDIASLESMVNAVKNYKKSEKTIA